MVRIGVVAHLLLAWLVVHSLQQSPEYAHPKGSSLISGAKAQPDGPPRTLHIAVFGGSTSTGGGPSGEKTPEARLWFKILEQRLLTAHALGARTGAAGRQCVVPDAQRDNALLDASVRSTTRTNGSAAAPLQLCVTSFARGATAPRFFAACFERFLARGQAFDLVFIETRLNAYPEHTQLVAAVQRALPSATVVVANQFSCGQIQDYAGAWAAAEHRHSLYSAHPVHYFDFLPYLRQQLGFQDIAEARDFCKTHFARSLFKSDRHHLSDAGHVLFGTYIADQVQAEALLAKALQRTRRHNASGGEAQAAADRRGYCLFADGPAGYDLQSAFTADGWRYAADVEGRPDKTCWITRAPGSRLKLKREVNARGLLLFLLFSNALTLKLQVLCNGEQRLLIDTTKNPVNPMYSTIEGKAHPVACKGTLEFQTVPGEAYGRAGTGSTRVRVGDEAGGGERLSPRYAKLCGLEIDEKQE